MVKVLFIFYKNYGWPNSFQVKKTHQIGPITYKTLEDSVKNKQRLQENNPHYVEVQILEDKL